MDQVISRQIVEDALDNAGVDYNGVNDTYSGRNMYDSKCLSFTIEGKRIQRDLCRFFVDLGMAAENALNSDPNGDNDLCGKVYNLADAVCTDDLGMDMIVYFPGWRLAS